MKDVYYSSFRRHQVRKDLRTHCVAWSKNRLTDGRDIFKIGEEFHRLKSLFWKEIIWGSLLVLVSVGILWYSSYVEFPHPLLSAIVVGLFVFVAGSCFCDAKNCREKYEPESGGLLQEQWETYQSELDRFWAALEEMGFVALFDFAGNRQNAESWLLLAEAEFTSKVEKRFLLEAGALQTQIRSARSKLLPFGIATENKWEDLVATKLALTKPQHT
ncbi:MAG: hypothetical protein ABI430_04125 [Candidatus Taylorbacteria bacterium]